MKILDQINIPSDLHQLDVDQLPQLAQELRSFVVNATQEKKGHMESSLAVTELTVALHYVLDTPKDKLFFDVGHQAYIHKVLTGRKDQFHSNRQTGGISGFPNSDESEYDLFTTGHSSTSISVITGMATSARLKEEEAKHVAVIGDGALTGGMAYEALNYLGESEEDVLIILNDNYGSIDDNIGGLQGQDTYQWFFESLGIYYLGEVKGNDTGLLVSALEEAIHEPGPRVLHIRTQKEALSSSEAKKEGIGFQEAMTQALIESAHEDERIVAISPAMLSGSGLTAFQKEFPQRCFDVGIAEQHAVAMAAGMAKAGSKVFCHLYSTFAQRGYDQIIHDVALQNLPVTLLLDRSGLVGADGPTHHGVFDLAFLNPIPNLIIASPANPQELLNFIKWSLTVEKPIVIRYPRGGEPIPTLAPAEAIELGRAKWLTRKSSSTVVVSLGHLASEVQKSIAQLEKNDTSVDHLDMRFLKPFDQNALQQLLKYDKILSVENGCIRAGFGKSLALALNEMGYQGKMVHLGLPDQFIEHGPIDELYKKYGLSADGISRALLNLIV